MIKLKLVTHLSTQLKTEKMMAGFTVKYSVRGFGQLKKNMEVIKIATAMCDACGRNRVYVPDYPENRQYLCRSCAQKKRHSADGRFW